MGTKQYYTDDNKNVSTFIDLKENYHSLKVRPKDIKMLSGVASPEEIADEINYVEVEKTRRAVGWKK